MIIGRFIGPLQPTAASLRIPQWQVIIWHFVDFLCSLVVRIEKITLYYIDDGYDCSDHDSWESWSYV